MGSSSNSRENFRFLVATDNHLGYAEKDPIRCNDSFESFEEVLEIAVSHKVDFILLGGDLFHENKPSRQCVVRCMDLLRKYTFGDRPVLFNLLSDPAENFKHSVNPVVNYMDPNLNVSLPVFSIHGNHDDPSGLGQMCALEMLSSAGVINYFGRTTDLKEIKITPLLLEKGGCHIAIYGLSSIKDERLNRLFREEKVKMLRPKELMDAWFNIMVLHQNHAKRGPTNYIPESYLDPFLDLVIWGHEHECVLEPREVAEGSFRVIQPGSSVATSLCEGEAVTKNVAIVEVNPSSEFRITPVPLKTVRPFVFDDLCLADHDIPDLNKAGSSDNQAVEQFVEQYIHKMLDRAKELVTGHPRQPTKPLIRLRVEYSNENEMFNICRFGHKFKDEVANPDDMILFKKMKQQLKKDGTSIDKEAMDAAFAAEDTSESLIEDFVEQYFKGLSKASEQMALLTERGMGRAVQAFVEKDDRDAIKTIVDAQIQKTQKHIASLQREFDENMVEDEIRMFRYQRMKAKEEEEEIQATLSNPKREPVTRSFSGDEDNMEDDGITLLSDSDADIPTVPARGRGSRPRRGRGSRGPRASSSSSRSAAAAATKKELSFVSDGSPKTASRSRVQGRGRGQSMPKAQTSMTSFMQSSQRSSGTTGGRRKPVVFDSDSDD